jgi:hypothetical protein
MGRVVTALAVSGAVVCASTAFTQTSWGSMAHDATVFGLDIVHRAVSRFCCWGDSFTFCNGVVSWLVNYAVWAISSNRIGLIRR